MARGVRSVVFFRRKPPLVPDPGQQVRLRTARGLWRGTFRAISGPRTTDDHEVVVWVAGEAEYQHAIRDGRRAIASCPRRAPATSRFAWRSCSNW